MVFLDCGNIDRTPGRRARARRARHPQHRPPPRQHALRDAQPRRPGRLVHRRDGVGPDEGARRRRRRSRSPRRCTSGVVTDTGRFMYENTGPRAHEMAAELIDGGIDVHAIYRRLYEGIPQGKLELLARGLSNVAALRRRPAHASPTSRSRTTSPPAPTRATPRASSTTCARSRAPRSPASSATCSARRRAASARCRCAPPTTASTSRASPARRAAAATAAPPASRPTWTSRSSSQFLRERRSCADAASRSLSDGVLLVDKPAGVTSHDVVGGREPRRRLGRGVKVGHAGTLDPFATGLLLVLVGRATRAQRFLMALPKRYETVARLGWTSTTGDAEGEIAPGRMPAEPLALPTGRDPPAPAGVLGRQGRRAARVRAGAPRRGGRAARARGRGARGSRSTGATASGRRSRSSARRAPTCARWSPTSATRTASSCGGPGSAPFDVADADPERLIGARRRARLPAGGRAGRATTPAAPPTAWRSPAPPRARSGCATTTA